MPGVLDPNALAGLLQPPSGFGGQAPTGFAGTSMWTGIPSGTSGLAADMPAWLAARKPQGQDLATILRGLQGGLSLTGGQPEMLSEWFGPTRVRG